MFTLIRDADYVKGAFSRLCDGVSLFKLTEQDTFVFRLPDEKAFVFLGVTSSIPIKAPEGTTYDPRTERYSYKGKCIVERAFPNRAVLHSRLKNVYTQTAASGDKAKFLYTSFRLSGLPKHMRKEPERSIHLWSISSTSAGSKKEEFDDLFGSYTGAVEQLCGDTETKTTEQAAIDIPGDFVNTLCNAHGELHNFGAGVTPYKIQPGVTAIVQQGGTAEQVYVKAIYDGLAEVRQCNGYTAYYPVSSLKTWHDVCKEATKEEEYCVDPIYFLGMRTLDARTDAEYAALKKGKLTANRHSLYLGNRTYTWIVKISTTLKDRRVTYWTSESADPITEDLHALAESMFDPTPLAEKASRGMPRFDYSTPYSTWWNRFWSVVSPDNVPSSTALLPKIRAGPLRIRHFVLSRPIPEPLTTQAESEINEQMTWAMQHLSMSMDATVVTDVAQSWMRVGQTDRVLDTNRTSKAVKRINGSINNQSRLMRLSMSLPLVDHTANVFRPCESHVRRRNKACGKHNKIVRSCVDCVPKKPTVAEIEACTECCHASVKSLAMESRSRCFLHDEHDRAVGVWGILGMPRLPATRTIRVAAEAYSALRRRFGKYEMTRVHVRTLSNYTNRSATQKKKLVQEYHVMRHDGLRRQSHGFSIRTLAVMELEKVFPDNSIRDRSFDPKAHLAEDMPCGFHAPAERVSRTSIRKRAPKRTRDSTETKEDPCGAVEEWDILENTAPFVRTMRALYNVIDCTKRPDNDAVYPYEMPGSMDRRDVVSLDFDVLDEDTWTVPYEKMDPSKWLAVHKRDGSLVRDPSNQYTGIPNDFSVALRLLVRLGIVSIDGMSEPEPSDREVDEFFAYQVINLPSNVVVALCALLFELMAVRGTRFYGLNFSGISHASEKSYVCDASETLDCMHGLMDLVWRVDNAVTVRT